MKLILAGTIENISTRNDGTIKYTLGCNEMDASHAGSLFQMRGRYVKCLLSDTNISEIEQKIIDEESIQNGKKLKSVSQRLRAVMFRLWEQSEQGDFDAYYRSEMEKIIDHYKGKLE